ncbi:PTS sugar transporter subunit IIA [uncultured Sphingomonas sp.]|uniref:PTS sugar transporter subunit IIA n=1 Tax=uncultured Sphingomonas sp. TaxID=158754 RepID=UPI002637DF65|nr:PTS sugar transporter subunit IIA [uncultured Sphingomonas sp.]
MTSDLSDLLSHDLILVDVVASSKKALFQHIAAVMGEALSLDPAALAAALSERERLGSTGFGGGVAIPHARVSHVPRIAVLIARLAKPIDFAAVDDVPVDIVVAMVSPFDAGAEHLKALARVSRRFRDRAFVEKLRGAGSLDAFYALLAADEAREAS